VNRPDHEDGPGTKLEFDEVFRAHFDAVWRVARSLAGPEAADDVTQEAFIVARRLLPRYVTGSLRGWLFAIVRNVARNDLRSRRRRQRHLEAIAEPPPDRSPQEWIELQDAARQLDAFTAALPEPQRVAFVLMDVEGLTAGEIAEAFGVPTRTVYSRVRIAREAFARFAERLAAKERRS
jgi:RNA polymerase sigma-70 factor, ECF subfamily